MKSLPRVLACACLLLLLPAVAGATLGPTMYFGEPDFEWYHPGGGGTPNHIWETGDYWAQDFATGLGVVDQLEMGLFLDDNSLTVEPLYMDMLLNGTQFATLVIAPGATGLYAFGLTLSTPIAALTGDHFRVQLLETNTIPFGQGSVSMGVDQTSYMRFQGTPAVPEPRTLALAGLGALGLLGVALRRRA